MKIIVKRVDVLEGIGLRVTINHKFETTPEGQRALRILHMHNMMGYRFTNQGTTIELGRGGNNPAINTTAACQRVMDQWANTPIQITFGQIVVGSAIKHFATLDELRQASVAHTSCWAHMTFKSNLPLLFNDLNVLEALLGRKVYRREEDDIYTAAVTVYLRDEPETVDPWSLMASFKPRIQAVLR